MAMIPPRSEVTVELFKQKQIVHSSDPCLYFHDRDQTYEFFMPVSVWEDLGRPMVLTVTATPVLPRTDG